MQGEQTQAVSSKSKEADGIAAVPDPPPPEEEEPPAETEPEGEEDGEEPKGEAEAEQKLPVPAKDPDAFPLKDGIIIDVAALPSVSMRSGLTSCASSNLSPMSIACSGMPCLLAAMNFCCAG